MYSYSNGQRQLVLHKGRERYIFRCNLGDEEQLLEALMNAAKDPRTSFDWYDAAFLSFKLTPHLIGQADQLLKGDQLDTIQQGFNPKDHYK